MGASCRQNDARAKLPKDSTATLFRGSHAVKRNLTATSASYAAVPLSRKSRISREWMAGLTFGQTAAIFPPSSMT